MLRAWPRLLPHAVVSADPPPRAALKTAIEALGVSLTR
jgi:hypothetical protein